LIVKEKGLRQVSDSGLISEMVETVLNNNPDEVQAYLKGKDTIANWLFGQVMQEAKGKANPQVVKKILQEQLKSRKL
jgi:aspartyl-tRNA(Asn)/glutamyl-tRNA(Gln) amidotransferase subunit B